MSLPLLITLFLLLFFLIPTISSAIMISRAKKRIKELEKAQARRQFADDIYRDIHESLESSLAIEKIVGNIAKRLESFLPATTLSTLCVTNDKVVIKIAIHEEVAHSYAVAVKQHMLDSLATLEKHSFRDEVITEDITGPVTDTSKESHPGSVFHLPLLLHNSVAAIITITAIETNSFATDDIEALQQIMRQTSITISKFDGLFQEEKGRLHAMIGSLNDGLFMIDAHNTLEIINPAAKHFLSLEKEDVTTMDVLSALPIHFDFRSKIIAAIHHNKPSEIANVPLKNKQLRCRITPVIGITGTVLGACVLMRDETLTNSVPRMKEDFTNIIVHELRNPLTSMKVSSDLLVSHEFTPEEQKRLLKVINQQSNRLLIDVQQILDAAKLEAGVFTLHKKTANLKDLITQVTEGFEKEAQQRMINLSVDVDFTLPAFSFDGKYLGQALTNLLSNSMKFTSQGGTVKLHAKQKQGNVIISIADTGAGIPKDKQHKLFNKFSQIEDASATVGKGLGLYVVRGIIEAHNGKVDIDSDQGRGTTITITLPLTEAIHIASKHNATSESRGMIN